MAYQESGSYSTQRPAARPAQTSSSGSRTTAAAPAGSKRPKEGTGGRRYVRTQAGAQRYKKPIGTEIIAQPRDRRGKQAQDDKESVDRYKALVSQDREKQEAALKSLNEEQLKRLSEVAFSFRSSDPAVARLRVGVAAELRRRNLDVSRYGGLSGRSRDEAGPSGGADGGGDVTAINWETGERYTIRSKASQRAGRKADAAAERDERAALREAEMAERARVAAARKAEAERLRAQRKQEAEANKKRREAERLAATKARNQARYQAASSRPRRKAPVIYVMTIPDRTQVIDLADIPPAARARAAASGKALPGGRFPIRNVADLRDAIRAFGRAKPQDRQKIARFICKRAEALNAKHLIGEGIRKAAGYEHKAELSGSTWEVEVVDLAGKWKHGWIPLDATAVREKTKGRSGAKPWWDGGAKGRTGSPTGKLTRRHKGGKLLPKHEGGKLTPRNTNPDRPKRAKGQGPARMPHTKTKAWEGKQVEWRRNESGTYDRWINGKRSKKTIDQGYTLQQVQQQNRGNREFLRAQRKADQRFGHAAPRFSGTKRKVGGSGKAGSSPERTSVVKSGMTEAHPLTRSKKPIAQMSQNELRAELNRAETQRERDPQRAGQWQSLIHALNSRIKSTVPEDDLNRLIALHDKAQRAGRRADATRLNRLIEAERLNRRK